MTFSTRAVATFAATALVGGLGVALPSTAAAAPPTLMISAYVEGSSNNKALEIYNPTGAPVDLTGYSIQRFSNGGTDAAQVVALQGTLAAGDHYVVVNSQAGDALKAYADVESGQASWNGDDAIQLWLDGAVVDSFGQTGSDPGTQWRSGDVSTLDMTLVRSVCDVDLDPADAFDPAAQYVAHPRDTFDVLGTFTCGDTEPPVTDPVPPAIRDIADVTVAADAPVSIQVSASDANGDTLTYSATGLPTGLAIDPATGLISGTVSELGSYEVTVTVDDGNNGTATTTFTLTVMGALPIGTVQGVTDTSPYVNQTVTVEGIVTGNFQTGGFNGYYIQDEGDDDPATSDGIFVYAPGAATVAVGTEVSVTGRVAEFNGQTQLAPVSVEVLATDQQVPAATELSVPVTDQERYESMLVTFPEALTIIEYFNFDRYGEIVYAPARQYTPTAVVEPGQPAIDLLAVNLANRLIVDDGRTAQNPTPAIHPNGEPMSQDNYFRGGDQVSNITGIYTYNFGAWKVQPTQGAHYTRVNERPEVPEVGGDVRVASMNVLNYFTTLTSQDRNARGADNVEEFERQQAKIVAAISQLDAHVVGLMEIENNGTAVENLVTALNAHLGEERYAAINTGVVGSDAIIQAIIYQPAVVEPVGDWAAFDYNDGRNRPTITQTFREIATGETFNVAVNHLKSKGSACTGDPDLGDGQANCNVTRVNAVEQMTDWLATDPTGQGETRTLVLGDMNAYDHEDPIDVFIGAGYTDLEKQYGGEGAYGYVFDGMIGYLDYALSDATLTPYVTGTASWHINADEADIFDYDTSFKAPAEQALWEPTPYRSSDHDPVLVGLTLTEPNSAPVIESVPAASVVEGSPASIQVVATDADGDTLSYAATGLPSGLTIDPDTGLISGTPTSAGEYAVTVTVVDGNGGEASTTFTLTVTEAPTPEPEPGSGKPDWAGKPGGPNKGKGKPPWAGKPGGPKAYYGLA